MGCDIHMVVEKQLTPDWWVTVNTMTPHHKNLYGQKAEGILGGWSSPTAISRNYRRFAALAGVRGDGPEPRGYAPNLSETALYLIEQYGADGHSHSWLPMTDAIKIFSDTEAWPPPDEDGEISGEQKYPASYFFGVEDEEVEKYRVVFWFDNWRRLTCP
jgi:hypothetical protein